MYFVVFWDKSSGIIHKTWVNTESRTFKWPKTKNPALQIMKAEVPKENWLTYEYTRLFGPFETYDAARQFELDTMDLSTNDDDGFATIKEKKNLEKNGKRKRNSNKPLRYRSSSDEIDTVVKPKNKKKKVIVSSSSSSDESEGTKLLPPAPTDYVQPKDFNSLELFEDNGSLHQDKAASQVKDSSESIPPKPLSPTIIIQNNNSSLSPSQDFSQRFISPSQNVTKTTPLEYFDKNNAFSSNIFSDFENTENATPNVPISQKKGEKPKIRKIETPNIPIKSGQTDMRYLNKNSLRQRNDSACNDNIRINEPQLSSEVNASELGCHGHSCCQKILGELKSLKTLVSSIYLTISDEKETTKSTQPMSFGLPIETKVQLTSFESKIKNAVAAAQYQKTVKQIGGLTFEKHVRNALVLTLSDIMAYQMSWTGAKNTIMVKDMKFIQVITDAVMEKWESADNAKIQAVIKSWLQHAGDRLKAGNNSHK